MSLEISGIEIFQKPEYSGDWFCFQNWLCCSGLWLGRSIPSWLLPIISLQFSFLRKARRCNVVKRRLWLGAAGGWWPPDILVHGPEAWAGPYGPSHSILFGFVSSKHAQVLQTKPKPKNQVVIQSWFNFTKNFSSLSIIFFLFSFLSFFFFALLILRSFESRP